MGEEVEKGRGVRVGGLEWSALEEEELEAEVEWVGTESRGKLGHW